MSLDTKKESHVHNIFQKIGVVKRTQLLDSYEIYRLEQLRDDTEGEKPSE